GEYSVGRAVASDIVIGGDQSVSRTHANIKVRTVNSIARNAENSKKSTKLLDLKVTIAQTSRLGTFINGTRIDETVSLNDNDALRFGAGQSMLRLVRTHVCVAFSGLQKSIKNSLIALALPLGCEVFDEKTEFPARLTHIIMPQIKITLKSVQALAVGACFVSDAWLKAISERASSSTFVLPNEKIFMPPISETENNLTPELFTPNPLRNFLFAELHFLFVDSSEVNLFFDLCQIQNSHEPRWILLR
ncbi:hypothetical protein HK100_006323, partial [Physocladia obscura]